MTAEERRRNRQAREHLVRGGTYRFDPPIRASGVPVGGPGVHDVIELDFAEGWYVGLVDENHVFQGKPTDDHREVADALRGCYFHVLFIGGQSVPTLVCHGPRG